MVEKKNADRVIDPKLLLVYILEQWKKILIGAVVISILFIGYSYISGRGKTISKAEYEQQMEAYEANVANQNEKIAQIREAIATLDQYQKDSVLCNIDPYFEVQANVTLSFTSAQYGLASLTRAYSSFVQSSMDYQVIADKLGMTRQCTKELVLVVPDYSSNTVLITVMGSDEDVPTKIMAEIVKSIENSKDKLVSKYGEHNAILSDIGICEVVDQTLIVQYGTVNSVFNQKMESVKTRMTALQTNLATLQQETAAIVKPKRNTGISKKDALLRGIPAFFVGIFLIAFYYVIKSFFKNTVNSESDLSMIYGIESLCVVPVGKETKNAFETLLARWSDSAFGIDRDVALEMGMMNINAAAKDKKTILVAAVCGNENTEKVAEELKKLNGDVELTYSSDINASKEELEKIRSVDGIVVMVERDVTKMNDVHNTLKTIRTWNKPVVGSIVL